MGTIIPFLLSKERYALANKLPFYIFNSAVWSSIPNLFHKKIAYIKYYLIHYFFGIGFDEVLWVDSDTMLPNLNVTVDKLQAIHFKGKKGSLLVQNGLWLNAGVFWIRNTPFTQKLLDLLWMDSPHFNPVSGLSDQVGLQHSLIKLIDTQFNGGKLRHYFQQDDYCIGLKRGKAQNKCWVQMVYSGPLKKVMLNNSEVQLIPWASSTAENPFILQCARIRSRYFSKQHCLGKIKTLAIHIGGHGHTETVISPWMPHIKSLWD